MGILRDLPGVMYLCLLVAPQNSVSSLYPPKLRQNLLLNLGIDSVARKAEGAVAFCECNAAKMTKICSQTIRHFPPNAIDSQGYLRILSTYQDLELTGNCCYTIKRLEIFEKQ